MPSPELLLSFLVTCTAIELTPGPNMSYLALLSAMRGRYAGFVVVAGVATGLALAGIIAALGAAAIIAESPTVYHGLRWVGVAYLLWLAYDSWRENKTTPKDNYEARLFLRGFFINLFNPKAALFYITILPNFTNTHAPLLPQTFLLTTISVVIATAVHASIVLLGARAKPYLEDARRATYTRRFFALLLVVIAIWFAFSTRGH